jgi:heme o synthase
MALSQQNLTHSASQKTFQKVLMLQTIKGFIALTKPRILVMLVFTSLCAAFVAQRGIPDFKVTFAMLVGLGLSSGGSAAINMWFDRDIDEIMTRTSKRPIPAGVIKPRSAFWFGILLGILSVLVLFLFVNPLTAFLSFTGYIYYAVIYTMWLKRSTPQNIVIGGGAGAMPVLIGWASVSGSLSLVPVIMFLVIFLWTPPHFWALALYKNSEYTRAGIPMMPVVRGARSTKIQSVIYSILLLLSSIALYFTNRFGILYLIASTVVGVVFLIHNLFVLRENDEHFVWAKRTFFFSLLYLPIVFMLMVIDSL